MKKVMFLFVILILCFGIAAAEDKEVLGPDIPPDASTLAYQVYPRRNIHVENENARKVLFYVDGDPEPILAYVVQDNTARLCLELAADDRPDEMVFTDTQGGATVVTDLLDPERGMFVYDQLMPDGSDGIHTTDGLLMIYALGTDDPSFVDCCLITGEEYIPEVVKNLEYMGYRNVRWEYADTGSSEEPLQSYILHVVDQNLNPVPEVYVSFCTDIACIPVESDDEGTIVFSGSPDVYHVQLIDVPDGYSFDEDFELVTPRTYGEWQLRVCKTEN